MSEQSACKRWLFPFLVIAFCLGLLGEVQAEAPSPYALVDEMQSALGRLGSYTVKWSSREQIKGKMSAPQLMFIKYSNHHIYMKALEGSNRGAELIFAPGWNKNKVRIHKGSFPDITLSLDPHGSLLMGGNHHPIEHAGLHQMAAAVAENGRRARSDPETSFQLIGEIKVHGQATWLLELKTPSKTKVETVQPGEDLWHFADRVGIAPCMILLANDLKDAGKVSPGKSLLVPIYYGTRVELGLSQETKLPTLLKVYDQHGQLYEWYEIFDLDTKAVLSDSDFDPKNPAYNF